MEATGDVEWALGPVMRSGSRPKGSWKDGPGNDSRATAHQRKGQRRDQVKRQDKERLVDRLRERFGESDVAVFTRFSGLSVMEMNQLRNELKRASVDYRVVKNTLLKRAMEAGGMAHLRDLVEGPLAVATTRGDIVALARTLTGFMKDHPKLEIHAGLLRGRVLDAKTVERAATLPSREELIGKLLYLLNSPVIRLMNALKDIPGSLVRTLSAIQDQKAQADGTP